MSNHYLCECFGGKYIIKERVFHELWVCVRTSCMDIDFCLMIFECMNVSEISQTSAGRERRLHNNTSPLDRLSMAGRPCVQWDNKTARNCFITIRWLYIYEIISRCLSSSYRITNEWHDTFWKLYIIILHMDRTFVTISDSTCAPVSHMLWDEHDSQADPTRRE